MLIPDNVQAVSSLLQYSNAQINALFRCKCASMLIPDNVQAVSSLLQYSNAQINAVDFTRPYLIAVATIARFVIGHFNATVHRCDTCSLL